MTPRERVLAAMNGEEIYPIPVDLYAKAGHSWELRSSCSNTSGWVRR